MGLRVFFGKCHAFLSVSKEKNGLLHLGGRRGPRGRRGQTISKGTEGTISKKGDGGDGLSVGGQSPKRGTEFFICFLCISDPWEQKIFFSQIFLKEIFYKKKIFFVP